MVCLSLEYKNQWGYGHLPSRCHGGSLGFSNGMKVSKGKKAIWKCIYCWSSLTYFSLHVWGCFKEICRRWETFTAMATHCLYLCVFGPNRLLVWETSAPKHKTSLCLGTAGLVCCLLCLSLRSVVESSPAPWLTCTFCTANTEHLPCVTQRVYGHPARWLNVSACVWGTLGRGWSELRAVRSILPSCGLPLAASRDSWRRWWWWLGRRLCQFLWGPCDLMAVGVLNE